MITDIISNLSEYIGIKKDDKKSRNNSNMFNDKSIDTSSVNKTEHLQTIKISTVDVSYSIKKDEDEFGNYVYKKIKLRDNQIGFEKTWLSVICSHLLYNRGNIRKIHHLSISRVLHDFTRDEFIKGVGKIFCFSININGKTKKFYCKKEQECQLWIEYLKKVINQRDFSAFYKKGEVISIQDEVEYFKGIGIKNKSNVLIKVIRKQENQNFELLKYYIKNEIDIMRVCKNSNVVRYIDDFEDDYNYFIITEFMNGGDIAHYFGNNAINDDNRLFVSFEIAKGINYLHSIGIMHRNITPFTVMVNASNVYFFIPKISDFRYSEILGLKEKTAGRYGHRNYMSPEIYKDVSYNKYIDIWNYGTLIYFIYKGVPPFNHIKDNFVRVNSILNQDITLDNIPDGIKELISGCMKRDPDSRYKSDDIVTNFMFEKFKK